MAMGMKIITVATTANELNDGFLNMYETLSSSQFQLVTIDCSKGKTPI